MKNLLRNGIWFVYVDIHIYTKLGPITSILSSLRGEKKRRRWRLNCGIPAHVHASITRILSAPLWHHRSNHPARFSPFCKRDLRFFRTPPFFPITVISQDQDFCQETGDFVFLERNRSKWMELLAGYMGVVDDFCESDGDTTVFFGLSSFERMRFWAFISSINCDLYVYCTFFFHYT